MHKDIIVFYGSLRSGTTLVRLMLDAHKDIFCPGERDFMFDFLGAGDAFVSEDLAEDRIFLSSGLSLPDTENGLEAFEAMLAEDRKASQKKVYVLVLHRGVAAAMRALPSAKFIHLLRDPRDVARSSIGMGWAGNTWFGVDHWIKTERLWDAHMTKDRDVLTLRYEDLLAAPEDTLKEVCDFVEVPFDPAMFEYDKHSTYGKIDPKLSYQWRNKQTAQEVSELEFKLGDLLISKGYDVSDMGPKPPSWRRMLQLMLSNKSYRWRKQFERHGLIDPILETLGRRLKLKGVSSGARARIRERDRQSLK